MIPIPGIIVDAMSGYAVQLGQWLRNPVAIVDEYGRQIDQHDESYFPVMHFVPLCPGLLVGTAARPLSPLGGHRNAASGSLLVFMREGYRYGAPLKVRRIPTRLHDMGLNAVVAT